MIAKFSIVGPLAAEVGTQRWYPENTVSVKRVYFCLGAVPGVQAVIDVKKNGVSIFSGAKPTCAAGNFKSSVVDTDVTLTPDEYLTVDVVEAAGSDAVVCIIYG
jgi:hypothetical protein